MSTRTTHLELGPYQLARDLVIDFTKFRGLYEKIARDASLAPRAADHDMDDGAMDVVFPDQAIDPRHFTYDWQMHAESAGTKKGYDGALLSTEVNGRTFYVIYHGPSTDRKDFAAIGRMVAGDYPKQLKEAKAFVNQAKRIIKSRHPNETVDMIHVGYSLGGAMGAMARDAGEPMIAFDSPAISRIMDKQGANKEAVGKNLINILPEHETLINGHGVHLGDVITSTPKFWETDEVSLEDFWFMSWEAHNLKRMGDALENMDEWKRVPATETGRAETLLDAFTNYFNEYAEGSELKHDARLVNWMKDHQLTRDLYETGSRLFGKLGRLLGGKTVDEEGGFVKRIRDERDKALIIDTVIR